MAGCAGCTGRTNAGVIDEGGTRDRGAIDGGGDIATRWRQEGEGPAVVFVHGIPTGPELWRHVLPRVDGAFEPVFSGFVRLGHDRSDVAAGWVAHHWSHYATHGPAASFVRQVRSLRTADTLAVADTLATRGVPARVVWGAADRFQKLRYGERLAADLAAPLASRRSPTLRARGPSRAGGHRRGRGGSRRRFQAVTPVRRRDGGGETVSPSGQSPFATARGGKEREVHP